MNIVMTFPTFMENHILKDPGQIPLYLSKLGNNLTILTYFNEDNKRIYNIDGVKLIKIRSRFFGNSSRLQSIEFNLIHLALIHYLIKQRKQIDCLFSYYNNTAMIPIVFKIIRMWNGISIIKMDSDGELYKGRAKLRLLKKFAGSIFFFLASKTIDLFIIESPEARQRLLTIHPWLRDKLIVLPNGVSRERFKMTEQVNIEKKSSNTILFVGDVIPRKGPDLLIKAFSKIGNNFPEWNIRIIGDLPQQTYEMELKKLISTFGLEERVIFTGRVSEEDLIKEHMHADIFCFPSRNESFGLALIEAMYFGHTIISSDVGVANYALNYGKAGLIFKNEDFDALASLLDKLMGDCMLREKLAVNAKKRCEELFDWEKIVSRLDLQIQELQQA